MTKLYIGNINFKTPEANLKTHFESFGKVKEAKLMVFRGYSKGYGFIEYETEEDAKKALAANGVEFEGRKLKVSVARPPKEKTEEKKEAPKRQTKPRGFYRRRYQPKRRFQQGRKDDKPKQEQKPKQKRQPRQKREKKDDKPREVSENTLFVKNIAFACKDEDLKELFKEYNVTEAKVITFKHYKSGEMRSKGFGFVEVKTAEDQKMAIEKLNGTKHMERQITVAKAFKRPEQPKA